MQEKLNKFVSILENVSSTGFNRGLPFEKDLLDLKEYFQNSPLKKSDITEVDKNKIKNIEILINKIESEFSSRSKIIKEFREFILQKK